MPPGDAGSGSDDQRTAPRAPIELRVEYQRLNTFFADYTKNICKGGTFIKTKKPLEVGTEFIFKLVIPHLGDPLALRGDVRWIMREGEPAPPGIAADHEPGMGIRFIYQSVTERQSIERTVEKLMVDSLGQLLYSKLMEQSRAAGAGERGSDGGGMIGGTRVAGSPLHWLRKQPFRFWLPNLVTASSITFGILSILSSVEGHPIMAAWFIVWCTLADKLDGTVARFVHGNSNFGVQLDSFGDFLAFGIAPATLVYSSLAHAPGLGYESGWHRQLLLVTSVGYVLAVCFRLARFNITSMPSWAPRIFFGVPTTVVGGTVAGLFLTLWKYGESPIFSHTAFTDFRMFGGLRVPVSAMQYFPLYLAIGAFLMVSTLRVPKLGKTPWPVANVAILALTIVAYIVGPARIVPEFLMVYGMMTIVVSFIYHLSAPHARKVAAPPLFEGGEAAERIVRSRLRATRREIRERRREERAEAKQLKQAKRKDLRKSS